MPAPPSHVFPDKAIAEYQVRKVFVADEATMQAQAKRLAETYNLDVYVVELDLDSLFFGVFVVSIPSPFRVCSAAALNTTTRIFCHIFDMAY